MNRGDMIRRVRSYTRDLSGSIFRTIDITDYINEGVDRIRSRIPQLKKMVSLDADNVVPSLLPSEYHYLIPVYASSRCFSQDERHYQASTLMNEFETKLEELFSDINEGVLPILDDAGNVVDTSLPSDYVKQVYFDDSESTDDIDLGVNGVE